ncbi:MAG: L,D-transpeptidase family protein [Candidatus Sericytochromatia bacterium]|nr:L,D-transpeptidase family protein [Candidatus Sericytochromatia bacterium]
MSFFGHNKSRLLTLISLSIVSGAGNAIASPLFINNLISDEISVPTPKSTETPIFNIPPSPRSSSPSTLRSDPPSTPEPVDTPFPSMMPTGTPITPEPIDTPLATPTPNKTPVPKMIPKPKVKPKTKVAPTHKPKPINKVIKKNNFRFSFKNDANTNKYILRPGTIVLTEYKVKKGDNLKTIAKKFAMRYRTLAKMNNATSPYLSIGQKVTIDQSMQPSSNVDGIVVNIPENRLYHFNKGIFVESFPVAVGLPDPKWQTPLGNYKISEKIKSPSWKVPISIQKEMAAKGRKVLTEVPAGPNNPLGNWWMGLSNSGVGIHSTNAPLSVGYSVSHGCIRMRPENAAVLFQKVKKDLPVRIIYQPVKINVDSGHVYLEAYNDVYNRNINTTELAKKMLKDFGLNSYVDPHKLTNATKRKRGISFIINK